MTIAPIDDLPDLPASLRRVSGQGGLPMLAVDNPQASALISLYGGQVLSYRPASGEELLFLSPQAEYRPGKAIRGGIPVCWPWFGPDPDGLDRPAHGFARTSLWRLTAARTDDQGTEITLTLPADDDTRALWPQAFSLTLVIRVGAQLQLSLTTCNLDARPFTISQALHSYLAVGDVARVGLSGLTGTRYLDKLDEGRCHHQQTALQVNGPVDRIYQAAPGLTLDDPVLGRRIQIRPDGSGSTVVWNPWIDGAARLSDLGDRDYQRMLCVEAANVAADSRTLTPGACHRLAVSYRLAEPPDPG